jgi:hypothetical protein
MRGGHGAGTVVTAVVLLLSLQHPPHSTAAQVLHHTLLPSISSPSSSVELTESRQMTPASLASYAIEDGQLTTTRMPNRRYWRNMVRLRPSAVTEVEAGH